MKRSVACILWGVLVFVVVFCVCMAGCKTGQSIPFFGGGSSIPKPPTPRDEGQAETFHNLRGITWATLIPGILMLGASYWIPPLRKLGGVFLAVGLGAALLPYFLGQLNTPLYWTLLCAAGALVLVGFVMLGVWLFDWWDYRRKRRALMSEAFTAEGDERQKLLAMLSGMDKVYETKPILTWKPKAATT